MAAQSLSTYFCLLWSILSAYPDDRQGKLTNPDVFKKQNPERAARRHGPPGHTVVVTACLECGFDYDSTSLAAAGTTIRLETAAVGDLLLGEADGAINRQPAPGVWSPLEYACHVRDALLAQRERTLLALVEDNPSFVPMYRDQRAVVARYTAETAEDVAAQLSMAAELFVRLFERLDDDQLARPCRYNYPERTQRIVEWLLVHTAHEVVHHAGDIRNGLGRSQPQKPN